MNGNMRNERWLGIDFSGNWKMWSTGCRTSNVWIAQICKSRRVENQFRLTDLNQVQDLPGVEPPFLRLARFLAKRSFEAAAIDAPFSIPAEFMPAGGYKSLLVDVGSLNDGNRPFLEGKAFVALVIGDRKVESKKPLRVTEKEWSKRGINVRSTLWAGARGGAQMTAACLTVLHISSCPVWPWTSSGPGLLIEGFPAAQLRHWQLPFQRYNGSGEPHSANRRKIVDGLRHRIDLAGRDGVLLSCADALDAVVCALTAASVTLGNLATIPDLSIADREGWIAISQ